MGRFLRTVGIAGSLGGLPLSTQALEAVELGSPFLLRGVSSPPAVVATAPMGESGAPVRGLDWQRAEPVATPFGVLVGQPLLAGARNLAGPGPYPAELVALAQKGIGLATGQPKENGETWGTHLLAGLTGIAFLMWRRMQWQ